MAECKSFILTVFTATVIVSGAYQPPKKTTVECAKDTDCLSLPNTFCLDNSAYNNKGACSCTFEYVLLQEGNNFTCLEEAKIFNDPCIIDDQCIPQLGEEFGCIQNKCKCKPGAHFINLKCWKSSKLGETCGNQHNCVATTNSECATGICKCVAGYIGNPAKTICLKIAQNIGDSCEDSVQCSGINSQVTCQFQKCLCAPGYISQGNNCVKPPAPAPALLPKHNYASNIQECAAMIFIASFLFCVKI